MSQIDRNRRQVLLNKVTVAKLSVDLKIWRISSLGIVDRDMAD